MGVCVLGETSPTGLFDGVDGDSEESPVAEAVMVCRRVALFGLISVFSDRDETITRRVREADLWMRESKEVLFWVRFACPGWGF